MRAVLGGRVRFIVSGGAPLAPNVENFCNVCLAPVLQVRVRVPACVRVFARRGCCSSLLASAHTSFLQGYGLTETCATSFCMLPDPRHTNTVGPPGAATEFRCV